MKYLLVFAVVLVAFWFWRQGRQVDNEKPPSAPPKPLPLPTAMVACLQCGTHLPETEAVRGQQGAYCSEEHRRLHESQAN
jgi:uncharacterized protein